MFSTKRKLEITGPVPTFEGTLYFNNRTQRTFLYLARQWEKDNVWLFVMPNGERLVVPIAAVQSLETRRV